MNTKFCRDCRHCVRRLMREPMCGHPAVSDPVTSRPLITARVARQVFCGIDPAFFVPVRTQDPVDEALSTQLRQWFSGLLASEMGS